jgi:tetratricopeptide (TPR) repeat protein
MTVACIVLALAMFAGCGERSGDKEYGKAMAAWKDGDLVRARTLLEKSIRKSSGNEKKSVAWNQLGIILWELGEIKASAEAFGKSCNLTETLTGANLNHGIALFYAGRTEEAEVALNNVLGDNPDNPTAHAILGLIGMQKKSWSNAAREIKKAAQVQPSNPASQSALVLAELHINRNSDVAVRRLKQILSTYPDYAPAAYNLGVIYDKWLGNKSAALSWYKQYLAKAGPNGVQAQAATRAIALLGGTAGTSQPTAGGQSNPDAAARFIAAGSKLHAAKNYADAVTQYQKAIQADPNHKNAHYNMGLAYYSLKKYSEAAQACINALTLDSRFSDARYMLALAYYQQQLWKDAEREANALKQTDPARADELLKYISQAKK